MLGAIEGVEMSTQFGAWIALMVLVAGINYLHMRRMRTRSAEELSKIQALIEILTDIRNEGIRRDLGLGPALSYKDILRIPHRPIKEAGECSICLEQIEAGTDYTELQCAHKFHATCIDGWLGIKSECPLCKLSIHLLNVESL